MNQPRQVKGIFGDFLGSVLGPLGGLAGSAFGPLGSIVGGGIGSAVATAAKKLPFKKGGVVVAEMAMPMKKGKAKKAPAKGSAAMKAKMARLRAMRGK